ncbi:MAG: hypothetical protein ABSH24_00860 [Bryobacteraceae bacterium]
MGNLEFAWDRRKARSNVVNRGVSLAALLERLAAEAEQVQRLLRVVIALQQVAGPSFPAPVAWVR